VPTKSRMRHVTRALDIQLRSAIGGRSSAAQRTAKEFPGPSWRGRTPQVGCTSRTIRHPPRPHPLPFICAKVRLAGRSIVAAVLDPQVKLVPKGHQQMGPSYRCYPMDIGREQNARIVACAVLAASAMASCQPRVPERRYLDEMTPNARLLEPQLRAQPISNPNAAFTKCCWGSVRKSHCPTDTAYQ
jgi:hypothetical protein